MASIPTGDSTFSMSFTNNLENHVDIPVPVWKTDLAMTQVMTISPSPTPTIIKPHGTLELAWQENSWIGIGYCWAYVIIKAPKRYVAVRIEYQGGLLPFGFKPVYYTWSGETLPDPPLGRVESWSPESRWLKPVSDPSEPYEFLLKDVGCTVTVKAVSTTKSLHLAINIED